MRKSWDLFANMPRMEVLEHGDIDWLLFFVRRNTGAAMPHLSGLLLGQ